MKRPSVSLFLLIFSVGLYASISINKLEPAFWWTGMKNPELQIMVYGINIWNAQVEVLTPGVVLKELVNAESPDYLFLYFDLSQATPGNVKLLFRKGKEKKTISYELKSRTASPHSHQGFSTSDVLYLLMPDRFANANPANDTLGIWCKKVDRNDPNARHGGDLAGIEQHLDYISDLGVTAIWLNPVLSNDMPGGSYHGYATTDFYNIDPRLGTNETYHSLVEKAHQKGLKVVMDMIFNHCGSEHIWRKKSPFKDWFNFPDIYIQTNHDQNVSYDPYASDFDKKIMYDGWFVESMPDLNQRNQHLAKYLIQNSIWWVEYAGIDAIRQDTYPYADAKMMAEWCRNVMAEYPDFNIVGEAWIKNTAGCAFWQAHSKLNQKSDTGLKSVMDFPWMIASHDAFHKETNGDDGLTRLYDILSLDYLYQDVNNLLVFLENHDTDRFLHEMPQNLSIFKQAYTFLLTTRGIPQIYYGSEILMNGIKKISDGYVRLDYPGGWQRDTINSFKREGRSAIQNEAFDFMKKLLNWRKNNDVIAKGSLRHFAPSNGTYVYFRSYQGKKILVMLNGKNSVNTISLERYAEVLAGVSFGIDIISGKTVHFEKELTLAPRGTLIVAF